MDRRDVLKRTALFSGAAIAAPLYSGLLTGCTSKRVAEDVFKPVQFTDEQYLMLGQLADALLPATDSPSATEAGVPQVIDSLVGEAYAEADRASYMEQFNALAAFLNKEDFQNGSATEREAVLRQLENSSGVVKEAWVHVKQQIIAMYLTSETVAENYLNYEPVPGTYEPCIKLSDTNGKAWAI